jgi:hypothetical protein
LLILLAQKKVAKNGEKGGLSPISRGKEKGGLSLILKIRTRVMGEEISIALRGIFFLLK